MHHAIVDAHSPSVDKVVVETAAAALQAAVRVEQRERCQTLAGTHKGAINPRADRAGCV